ncbi:hypothetical protein BDV96DRAFT_214607 [Lophiotrema nucula]|uniref:Uncharacterized protein n=1 Tax=Lophiotrema nucula TaxID=690887 RepID=A0A6A5ZQS2_9PLEO|nr:hypothetical protein BDV96DRAFT_214607 [Lophiotrema nucula]
MSNTTSSDVNPSATQPIETKDPFSSHREQGQDPFEQDKVGDIAGPDEMRLSQSPPSDRRMSREWDASKVPPSQFQRRKGSIYSTPSSRDGHTRDKDQAYWDKLKEKGWIGGKASK